MEFKEYIPQGGWIKYHERVRREARHERILQVVMPRSWLPASWSPTGSQRSWNWVSSPHPDPVVYTG